MGRNLLSGLLLLAFGGLNAFAVESPEKPAVGLGEVCDKKNGPFCKSGLDCNSSEPDKAGCARTPRYPNRSYRQHPNALSKIQTAPSL